MQYGTVLSLLFYSDKNHTRNTMEQKKNPQAVNKLSVNMQYNVCVSVEIINRLSVQIIKL